jgi:hypothetical protein
MSESSTWASTISNIGFKLGTIPTHVSILLQIWATCTTISTQRKMLIMDYNCDAFARSGRSPCFHFEPLGLSRCTTKSCVAICSLLCSFLIPYVLLPFTCPPSGSRTFHDMHSHWTLFHLKLYLHSPAACHSRRRLRTSTICRYVAVSTSPHASYHSYASPSFTCLYVYCSCVILGHFLCS